MAYRDSQISRELITCARLAAPEMISQSGAYETGSHLVINHPSVIVATASRQSPYGRRCHPRVECRPVGCRIRRAVTVAIFDSVDPGTATTPKTSTPRTSAPKAASTTSAKSTQQTRAKAGKAALAGADTPDTCSGSIQPSTIYPCSSLAAGETHTYSISLPSASDLVFIEISTTDGEQLPVTLTAPDTSSVACQQPNWPGPYVCPTSVAGTYSLQVTSNGDPTGYTVDYVRLLSGGSCSTIAATDLSFSAPVRHGSLAAGSVGDCFNLAQSSGTVLRSVTSVYEAMATIYDATGTAVCTGGADCTLTGTAPYHVLLSDVYGNATDYDWRLVQLSNPQGCANAIQPAAYGTTPPATSAAECRIVNAPKAGPYRIEAWTPDGGYRSGWIYSAKGAQICELSANLCTLPAGTSNLILDISTTATPDFAVEFIAANEARGCASANDTGFASGASTGSFAGAGELICLTLPTASGKDVSIINGMAENVIRPNAEVDDATGTLVCELDNEAYGNCALAGTAPFHVLLSGATTGKYRMVFQRTDSAAGCVSWPESRFNGAYGAQVALAADNEAACLSIPAGQHSTGEMIDYTDLTNKVNGSITIIDPSGNQICVGVTSSICAMTPGVSYTALLIGYQGADTYGLVRRDISASAPCGAPNSLAVGGASTPVTLTSMLDARCYRVKAAATDKLTFGIRVNAPDPTGAMLEVADNAGHIVCRQFGVPCNVTGVTSYQIIVVAVNYNRTSIMASLDTWLVGTAAGWSSTCVAHQLSMSGFAPINDTLTESHTGYCAVLDVGPNEHLGVYGSETTTRNEAVWVSIFDASNWTQNSYCSNQVLNYTSDTCGTGSNTAAAQAVMLIFPYDVPVPFSFSLQGVCMFACGTLPVAPTISAISVASGQSGSIERMVVTGTALTMGDVASLSQDGQNSPGRMSAPVSVTADGTKLTLDFSPYDDPGVYDFTITAPSGQMATLPNAFKVTAAAPPLTGDSYQPLAPTRILDTRYGLGAPLARVGAGKSVTLQVDGAGGVPDGVDAVVLNLTAVNPSENTYLTVYPDGSPLPSASNLNVRAGQTLPNLVTVQVVNGSVDIKNQDGTVDLLADVVGYYFDATYGWGLHPVSPKRILDTRKAIGAPTSKVGPGGVVALKVAGVGQIPANGVTAVVMNVTAVNPTASSYLTVYPDSYPLPTVSSLNYSAGETVANLVTVPVVDGKVDLRNANGTVDLLADVTGYYSAGGAGFHAVGSFRLMDTRYGTGVPVHKVGPNGTVTLSVVGRDNVPLTGVSAVILNVTVTSPTAASYLSVYPDSQSMPDVSNLNFGAGQTIANLVVVPVVDGKVDFHNEYGSTEVIADLDGYFTK